MTSLTKCAHSPTGKHVPTMSGGKCSFCYADNLYEAELETRAVQVRADQIVIDRQALLAVVRAIDAGAQTPDLPKHMDKLREPFFVDEISSGQARTDFTMNRYEPGEPYELGASPAAVQDTMDELVWPLGPEDETDGS
jgi:hypothetical protein